ncbi:hypothetical protein UA08_01197 [Talaromyces atroroseus]|uniref:Ubiquitin carrier protein n=1 Tax=Talaromyces atroroseus TaxID=1441469 RepID=A0A1Q5QAW2_TALAT|nr:hypothetical protein UA08_01197 [Talaromyces atroroseus]OKL62909.1 hypothetical protein UA08_01197 [Talaromyces atroroseus]
MSALGALALVRRGIENPDVEQPPNASNPLPVVILSLTVVLFAAALSCASYSLGKVVTTIAAVEDPNPDVYVRIENDTPVVPESALDDVESLPPPKPITSSLRATVRHLNARGGRRSLFRGIILYILTGIAINVVSYPASAAFNIVGSILARFVAEILLANLRVGWIHIVISEPSKKSLWSRIPVWRKTVVKIAPAAAIRSAVAQIVTFVPILIANHSGIFSNALANTPKTSLSGGFGLVALHLVLYVLVQMPAEVTFIRVAASMLPEDDESIVPFDRSFGGKVTPEIVGGQGKIGIVDAWRSFGWGSRMRFLSVVGKVFLVQVALGAAFWLLLATELVIISSSN